VVIGEWVVAVDSLSLLTLSLAPILEDAAAAGPRTLGRLTI
jgi:hypothetical protein